MSSRALMVVLVLVALVAAWLLVWKDLLSPKAGPETAGGRGEGAPGAHSASEKGESTGPEPAARPTLAVADEASGEGAVVLRVLAWKDRKPVASKLVRLSAPGGKPVERATGDDGRVLFSDVPAGREWVVRVDVPPFAPVEMKGIQVRARRPTDLGDLLLGEKVVLHGKVVDERGKPVPGAAVSAFTGGGFDLSQGLMLTILTEALNFPTPVDEAKSDEQGLFALASLSPGTYRVMTKRAGYAMDIQSDIVVSPERQSGLVTIMLGPPATLHGRVLDEAGGPVAGATVLAVEDFGRGGGPNPVSSSLRKDFTLSGPDGRYVLDTLIRDVRYRFGVVAKGRAPIFDAQATTVAADGERDFTIALGGSIAGHVIDSQSGKPIENARVVAIVGRPQMGGGGRGPGGRGGTGGDPAAAEANLSTQFATTDASGAFRMDALLPGPIAILQVRATGYSEPAPTGGGLGAMFGANAPQYGDVVAGETTTVELKLEPGGVVTGRVLTQGAGQSVPVPGAQVAAIPMITIPGMPGTAGFPNAFGGYPTAVADADGRFRIDGVRTGATVAVIANAPGFVAGSPTDASTQVAMPATGGTVEKDATLAAAGAVEGVVKTSKGEVVAGARVRTRPAPAAGGGFGARGGGRGGFGSFARLLFAGAWGGVVLSDADGRYRIENVPTEDSLTAEADTDDLIAVPSEPFTVRAGETQTVDLVVQGGGTIRGRVIDDHGKVVAGARLRVGTLDDATAAQKDLSGWRADGLLEGRVIGSDAEGWFEIPRVKPGKVMVKGEQTGFITFYRRDLVVAPDQVIENYVVSLTRGETISGVVKGDDGKPLEGITVSATARALPTGFGMGGGGSGGGSGAPSSGDASPNPVVEPSLSGRTDADGRFTIEGVPSGATYAVLVYFARGYRGWAQGDDAAMKRDISPGARDLEFKLNKAPEPSGPGVGPFPLPPGVVRPPVPPAPGMSGMGPIAPSGMGG